MSEEKTKNAWLKFDEKGRLDIFNFCEGYKNYMSVCKTERESVLEAIRLAEEKGYKDLNLVIKNGETLKSGDKVYLNNKDKALVLFLIGNEPIENGMRIIGSHVDSPRLDLKQHTLYEDGQMALMDTHYYGGIKKYQWIALPLAIHGVVVKKDGTKIDVVIGEDDNDPVVGISDLLVHLSGEQLQKKANEVIHGEDLNVLVGNIPLEGKENDAVKANILKLLKDKYDFEEEDFISAEIEVVPAGKARDLGLDRSMVMAYGQDDRICAYTSLMALLDLDKVEKTSVILLVDKEEVGSQGATGMHSRFFENAVAEIMDRLGQYSELKLRRALSNSAMLSADVTAAFDPNYASAYERKNTAYFGRGLVFSKYTGARGKSGCNDANPEFIAWLRNIMDKNNIAYQTAELGKVDQGGGGTIAYILAEYNMEVIDCGVALQNMHAPWEVSSKVDIYETMRGYKTFLIEK
ncbi:aminopeptidase [Clostridium sp. NSJ-49]|uniref:M18 family aminopeptidase n=1 Tax=Clostridium disporicum TaxID=84024 RepID=A0A174DLL0_9CLOT|nr:MULTISPECIES: aminopeptidase [Clostridium]MBC5626491.1 aminopeptidase [Clostridium sp. NSJ-49]MCD2500466.1 aminopeptidase [Clostridium sp. NSJ-145]MDU6341290.1 aminopeptidase [Clostridium sp.]CUO26383.1 aminopeptidase 1 [Clostridium disporicum]